MLAILEGKNGVLGENPGPLVKFIAAYENKHKYYKHCHQSQNRY